jgi:hypothetical protein
MNAHPTRQLLTGFAVACTLAIVAACSGTSPSMNPTSPSVSAVAGANFSPNPDVCPLDPPWSDSGDGSGTCVCLPPNILDAGPPATCFPPKEPPPPTGKEGCTPGYWKANAKKGAGEWPAPYLTSSTLESVFDVPDALGLDDDTLLEALEYGGGSGVGGAAQILLRAGAAALLNAQSSGVAYPLTTAQVIAQVNSALASGSRDTMLAVAGQLDADNNLGCPLDNNGR